MAFCAALPDESVLLSGLALRSKAHWNFYRVTGRARPGRAV
ncbi:MAG TPA: hypothetical protein QF813_10105 [Alphaproteobacteria bacterium]|jgi:hypothetical protein|nr:hypothetical protein [Alphaproteobacteria bacterium]